MAAQALYLARASCQSGMACRNQNHQGRTLRRWRMLRGFVPETPVELVWQPGLNWAEIVAALEANPLPWQSEIEARNKELQARLRAILEAEGELVAQEWLLENVIKPLYGGEADG